MSSILPQKKPWCTKIDQDKELAKFYDAFKLWKSGHDLQGNWNASGLSQALAMLRHLGQ
jgi:hypothetical protein